MGEIIKERNYRYDALRGICMFLIVLQHFTFKGGYEFTDNAGNLIYVGIDIFVMQAFFFLSGMFSKNPGKNRDKLFGSLLWPVIIVGIVFWPLAAYYYGFDKAAEMFQAGSLPYAMWFLVVLFVYKFFQKFYVKIPHLPAIALGIYLLSGIFEPLSSSGFAVSRMCTFFFPFVAGYYMTIERVEKLKLRSAWQIVLLGAVLCSITVLAVCFCPENIAEAIKLKASFSATHMSIAEGILFRAALLAVSFGWILFLLSILSAKQGFWAHIGMNTMPIYIFHMLFVLVFKVKGFTFGYFDFKGYEWLYLICLLVISFAVTVLLSGKPVQKAYSLLIDKSYMAVNKLSPAKVR